MAFQMGRVDGVPVRVIDVHSWLKKISSGISAATTLKGTLNFSSITSYLAYNM